MHIVDRNKYIYLIGIFLLITRSDKYLYFIKKDYLSRFFVFQNKNALLPLFIFQIIA